MCEITVDISNINYKTDTCHSKKKKRKKKENSTVKMCTFNIL